MVFLVTLFLANPLSGESVAGLILGLALPYQAAFAFSAVLALSGKPFSIPACEGHIAEAFACRGVYASLPQMVIRLSGARYMPSPSATP